MADLDWLKLNGCYVYLSKLLDIITLFQHPFSLAAYPGVRCCLRPKAVNTLNKSAVHYSSCLMCVFLEEAPVPAEHLHVANVPPVYP